MQTSPFTIDKPRELTAVALAVNLLRSGSPASNPNLDRVKAERTSSILSVGLSIQLQADELPDHDATTLFGFILFVMGRGIMGTDPVKAMDRMDAGGSWKGLLLPQATTEATVDFVSFLKDGPPPADDGSELSELVNRLTAETSRILPTIESEEWYQSTDTSLKNGEGADAGLDVAIVVGALSYLIASGYDPRVDEDGNPLGFEDHTADREARPFSDEQIAAMSEPELKAIRQDAQRTMASISFVSFLGIDPDELKARMGALTSDEGASIQTPDTSEGSDVSNELEDILAEDAMSSATDEDTTEYDPESVPGDDDPDDGSSPDDGGSGPYSDGRELDSILGANQEGEPDRELFGYGAPRDVPTGGAILDRDDDDGKPTETVPTERDWNGCPAPC